MLDDIAHGDARIWTIRRDRDGAFIGVVDLGGIGERSADLGFMIRRDFWGRGYAFGAATLAVRHGWAMGLARLNARCHEDNRRSQRLLLRLGFTTLEAREMGNPPRRDPALPLLRAKQAAGLRLEFAVPVEIVGQDSCRWLGGNSRPLLRNSSTLGRCGSWRETCRPDARSRPPLCRLHGAQAVTTLSQVVRPPRERGIT